MTPPSRTPDAAHRDAYGVERYISHRLEQLRGNGPVGEDVPLRPTAEARKAILKFMDQKTADCSLLRKRTYLAWLPLCADRMGPEFLKPTKAAPSAFDRAVPPKKDRSDRSRGGTEGGYSRGSRATAAQALGAFWRWKLGDSNGILPSYLRIKVGAWKPSVDSDGMLSVDDVRKLAAACETDRDRAWIWTVYASACRPGEIFRLRLGDVIVHKEGFVELKVKREKGSTSTPAFVYQDAVPALLAWLRSHPMKDEPSAPLWVLTGGDHRGQAATYRGMYAIVERAAERAKIGKPTTLYNLRRSRLTQLAREGLNASMLEQIAGWSVGSPHAKHYIRLSGTDVQVELNARYGITERKEAPKIVAETPITCGRCDTMNPAEASYCMKCAGPLSVAAVEELRAGDRVKESLTDLLRDPKVVEVLARALADKQRAAKPAA